MKARKITAMATVALLTSLTVAGCSNDINEPITICGILVNLKI